MDILYGWFVHRSLGSTQLLNIAAGLVLLAAVELDQGKTVEGETAIEFANDGTTDGATIVLENEDGDAIFIEIAPLADAVRIFHAN